MNLELTKSKYIVVLLILFATNSINADVRTDTLSHFVIGHMCLFNGTITESYEINYEKKVLFRLTIHANYLHIKGEKYRSKIRTSKKEWIKLNKLADNLRLACKKETIQEENDIYFISLYKSGKLEKNYSYSDTNVPQELKDILMYIRGEITVGNNVYTK